MRRVILPIFERPAFWQAENTPKFSNGCRRTCQPPYCRAPHAWDGYGRPGAQACRPQLQAAAAWHLQACSLAWCARLRGVQHLQRRPAALPGAPQLRRAQHLQRRSAGAAGAGRRSFEPLSVQACMRAACQALAGAGRRSFEASQAAAAPVCLAAASECGQRVRHARIAFEAEAGGEPRSDGTAARAVLSVQARVCSYFFCAAPEVGTPVGTADATKNRGFLRSFMNE
jgi:hypothetical protein